MRNKISAQAAEEFFVTLTIEFDKESDRALGIMAGTYIEYLLEQAIIKRFKISSKVQEELFEGATSFLGTFASKIAFSYLTGIINDKERNDIHNIKQIRNEFAHKIIEASFSSKRIIEFCRKLEFAKIDAQPPTAREQFKKSTIRLIMAIMARE